MGNYSDVEGAITYDFIEDEKVLDRVKSLVNGEGITGGLSEVFGIGFRDRTISLFRNHAEVDEHGISIRPARHHAEFLKAEILMITQVLEHLGVTGIHVDIERKGRDLDGDKCIERYKIEEDGYVTSDKEKIA